jgi:uncharacterized protein YbjQ (UPF0145 family)
LLANYLQGKPIEDTAKISPTIFNQHSNTMIVTSSNDISGRSISGYIGIVRGIVVRSPSITQGVMGGLKQIIGGNIESYARVCEAAREEAYTRMVQQAQAKGADAIIAMRYDATEFAAGVTEVLAYGTAVKLDR